jgi:hypothetical protein
MFHDTLMLDVFGSISPRKSRDPYNFILMSLQDQRLRAQQVVSAPVDVLTMLLEEVRAIRALLEMSV